MLFELFQFTFICKCECDVIVGYWILSHRGILSEMDSGYYPTQMERRDWSDSFVYVTMNSSFKTRIQYFDSRSRNIEFYFSKVEILNSSFKTRIQYFEFGKVEFNISTWENWNLLNLPVHRKL